MRTIAEIFRSHAVFDADGRHVNGTDKMSNHDYGDAYESMFHEYMGNDRWRSTRGDVELMMEVGVADGSSLCAWREVFPNAHIVGMDVHHSDRAHGPRMEFHIGDQRSREDCLRAAGGRLFDLIVEDAAHKLENTLLTLLWLWPAVRPGGLYVVEEFAEVGHLRHVLPTLIGGVEFYDTRCPHGGTETLVAIRKPL